MTDGENEKAGDDAIESSCKINAKIVTKLFDKVSALKQKLEQAGLDQDSREYIKLDTSITYYSDKLQDLQGKTNPGVDQSKIETALDKIGTAIEQLDGEIGGGSVDDSLDQVASPEQIGDGAEQTNEQPADGEMTLDEQPPTDADPAELASQPNVETPDVEDLFK